MKATVSGAVRYLWAAPITAVALTAVPLALASGGKARIVRGVLEVYGGMLRPLLRRGIPGFPIGAITLGHVVLASSERELTLSRAHERVHVRQYERWGLLFPLLYVASSAVALGSGRGAYGGNAFEREAFRADVLTDA
ncbi:MAG: hypothetical protein ABI968_08850 [Acidobacteriota bacterium]